MAEEFLKKGYQVVINGRSSDSVERAVADLSREYSTGLIFGSAGDVGDLTDVQRLWNQSAAHFGQIDIWINNAGLGSFQQNFWKIAPDEINKVVHTNLVGSMYGSQVALREMIRQGSGELYNMEGFGSDGRFQDGLLLYGTTKRAIRYFSRGLVKEAENTPVIVGTLSPGMVVTDLLVGRYRDKPEEWDRVQRIFNILADQVETVTPFLVQKIIENHQNGANIRWLTGGKILWRFLTASISGRDIFADFTWD
jgi:NAD(P)-dependent dehydrogenase (short-subunit alcohol dehydrogenase family)